VEEPTGFKSPSTGEGDFALAPDWWRLYTDADLDQLIATAQAANQTLRQAVARVDEARALARVAGSYLYPTVSLDPNYSRTRYSGNRRSTVTGNPIRKGVDVGTWTIPIDLAYEIDVWGRVRRSLEASRAVAAAAADDVGVVRLIIETDVAQYYYTIRTLDAQVQILKETVASYEEQVRLLSVQPRTGLVSGIVVSQAQAQLKATLAQMQNTERARANTEHALAILCGRPAPSFTVASNPLHEVSPPVVPAGLPVQLLTRRPDVAEAEKNVVAANAQIGMATAEFYPRFMLTASAGFSSVNAETLFSWQSRVASIMPSISIPLFQGGRLRANLEATKARYRQTVAVYVQQVLVAYGDVEDALSDVHSFGDQVASLRDAVAESRNYLRLAQVQYRQGLVDYLIVIDAERTLLANQLSLAQAVNFHVGASIHLVKALGGGWTPAEERSARSEQ
jgi:multidrug efflux system outer membrane protein